MMALALIWGSQSFHLFGHSHKNSTCPSQIFRVKQVWVLSNEFDVDLVFVLRPPYLLWLCLLNFIFFIFLSMFLLLFLFNFLLPAQNLKSCKVVDSSVSETSASLFRPFLFLLSVLKTAWQIIHDSLWLIPKIISNSSCWLNIYTIKLSYPFHLTRATPLNLFFCFLLKLRCFGKENESKKYLFWECIWKKKLPMI